MFALPQDDIIVLTKNTFKKETDDNSDVALDFFRYKAKVYISDSSGLKFTAVEDLLEDSPNTDHGQMFTYVTRLFNFKGVLALSRQKMDFLRDNSKEGSLELVIDPGLISFDDGNTWDTFKVKNDKDFICNPETSPSCKFRIAWGSSEFVSQLFDIDVGDRLMTPGIASIQGIISEDAVIDSDVADKKTMTFMTRDFGKLGKRYLIMKSTLPMVTMVTSSLVSMEIQTLMVTSFRNSIIP